MPGLSLVGGAKQIPVHLKVLINQSLESTLFAKNYKKKIFVDDSHYLVGAVSYDEYPITFFENDEFIYLLEGRFYGLDSMQVKQELHRLATDIITNECESTHNVAKWLLQIDGEFIILLISKIKNRIIILNDILGRLPLYYSCTDDGIVISRDLFFISRITGRKELDKMGIAQYLLFAFPLAERTLFDKVSRLKAASLMRIDLNNFQVNLMSCHQFNFEHKNSEEGSPAQNARELACLLSQASLRRHDRDRRNILSMSGGLDSRSVAACLCRNNIPFISLTRLTNQKKSADDAKFAKQISEALKFNWSLLYTDPPKATDIIKLLMIKNGSNYLAMSYIIPFLESIRDTYGSEVTYWTGDGGDKVIPDLRPSPVLRNLRDLVGYIMAERGIPLSQVSDLTRINQEEIIEEVNDRISGYPERTWAQKYIHFLIYERAPKFLFEGEDRNRCYFWHVTPFYSTDFFRFAIGISDDQKAGYQLYQKFIGELSENGLSIDDPDHKLPKFSENGKNYWRKRILNNIPLNVKKGLRRYRGRIRDSKYSEILLRQIDHCDAIDAYLSIDAIRKLLSCLTITEVQTLLTITSVVEILETGQSSLADYGEMQIL